MRQAHVGTVQSRLTKFVIVGGLGIPVNVAVFAILLELGKHYFASGVAAWMVAASVNFFCNWAWTYERPSGVWSRYPRAMIVRTIGGIGNMITLVFLVAIVQAPSLVAAAAAAVAGVAVNFTGAELWTFAKEVTDNT